jgi:Na+/H+ antiporter NhaD/arsenite permease-like protein
MGSHQRPDVRAVMGAWHVLAIGWIVLWSGVYLSALVDWHLIMRKVSGISCPRSCERPGKQRWAGITALWCFHRGVARLLVPAVLIGCPTVIGALSESSGGRAICFRSEPRSRCI